MYLKRMLFTSVIAVIALALPALAQIPGEQIDPDLFGEDAHVLITAIEFRGNREISDQELLNAIGSRIGDELSESALVEDFKRLIELGYFRPESVDITLEPYAGGARVVFIVEENPIITAITIEGNELAADDELRAVMHSRVGTLFSRQSLDRDVMSIQDFYDRRKDAPLASIIDYSLDTDGVLRLVVAEGRIERIELVNMDANPADPDYETRRFKLKTKPRVIKREMKLRPGDVITASALQRDITRLHNLGYFEDINVEPVPVEDRVGYFVIRLLFGEARTGQVGFGAGYSSSEGMVGFLDLEERNLRGRGQRASMRLSFGGNITSYQFGYFEPYLDKNRTSGGFNIFHTEKQVDYITGRVDEVRKGWDITLSRPVSEYARVSTTFQSENVTVKSAVGLPLTLLSGATRSLRFGLVQDKRNNYFTTTSGYRASISSEFTGGFLGGDFDYNKYESEVRWFTPINRNHVLGVRVLARVADYDTPLFDWFELGGVYNLRGFDDNAIRGTKSLLANAEYRFPMAKNFSGVFFVDSGAAWRDMDAVDLGDMQSSAGFGIRFQIPALGLQPVRLDFAFNLEENDNQIHFALGHMF